MNDEPSPADLRRWEEQRELLRIAAQRLLDEQKAGRKCDPHTLIWAQGVCRNIKPLGRPLSSGEPA
jgi:hypothetical protein